MNITSLTDATRQDFRNCLFSNELQNNSSLIYRFSYAGGKSGLSFGISQLDICNNAHALLCLRDASFTTDEVAYLKTLKTAQGLDAYDARLLAQKTIVDKYDNNQISDCETWPLTLCNEIGVDFLNEEAFIGIADYSNQLSMSRGGKMYMWLKSLTVALTHEMVRDFKLNLPWGISNPDDVNRRYANIVRIMRPIP